MISRKLAVGIVTIVAVLSMWSAQSAFADSTIDSTDAAHGSHVVWSSANDHLNVVDTSYDGWGAYSKAIVGPLAHECIDGGGYNSSHYCLIIGAGWFFYNSCLEHNNGITLSNCSGNRLDYSI
jgi:hypothetical protein